jgi:hypothetical protein
VASHDPSYGDETKQKHHHALGKHHHAIKVIQTPSTVNDVHAGATFQADLPTLQVSTNKINQAGDDFTNAAEQALPQLPHQIPAGTGPIGVLIGHRFNHMFSAHGGLRHAITTHVAELGKASGLMSTTTANYQQVETDTAQDLAERQ